MSSGLFILQYYGIHEYSDVHYGQYWIDVFFVEGKNTPRVMLETDGGDRVCLVYFPLNYREVQDIVIRTV